MTVDPTLMPYPQEADGYATVIQTGKPAFQWSDATLNFKRPNKNNLVIYELWVYDHTQHRSIAGLMDRLQYFEDMGVNAIELMPVTEFDGNENWGYSPNHYFALDKAYGTPEQMKTFVDECHKRGIAVILDMVFNHSTGLNPMNKLYPYGDDLKYNPWFNVTAPHPDNVYEDWNHDFAPAKKMMIRALNYWLTEYKVDGFRMDLSHGLCGTTYDAMDHITDYYEKGVKAVAEDAYFILEHWGPQMSSERPKLINQGMLCWDNTTNAYYQTAMGWLKDGDSFTNANRDGYVTYCESHDEERAFFKAKQYGNGDLKTDDEERIARVPLNMAFLTLLNGPQMFYHFAEFGFDYSKYQNQYGQWGTNPYSIKDVLGYEAKMQPKKRIETWLGEGAWRTAAFHKVGQTIQLRTRIMPEVFEGNPTKVLISGGKKIRTIQWGSDVFVVGNFDVAENQTATLPEGTWYNYFEQTKQATTELTLAPGEVMIFTGREVELPEMQPFYCFMTDLENVIAPQPSEILPPYNVQVYTLSGQVIMQQSNVMAADLNALGSGLYIVQYEKNGQRVAKKVIR
jgi:glycosidase